MTEWKYVKDRRCVVEQGETAARPHGRVVAIGVMPGDGSLLALAPRMEAWMRSFQGRKLQPEDFARLHDEAQAIFRELDEARAEVGS